jgi:amino acid adenylation domain-containing protein
MDLSAFLSLHLSERGEQIALRSGPRTWSYAELDRVTRERAAALRAMAPDNARVVLAGEHTAEAVLWALAVMRAGLVYTPFNPGLPGDRMREALALAAPGLVLCCSPEAAVRLRQASTGSSLIMAGEAAAAAGRGSGEPPAAWPVREVAYSMFTSGSSGLPKLVNVGHRGIGNLCRAQRCLFAVEPGQRVLQFSSLAFDASISELLVTLYAGATLDVPEWNGGSWVTAVGHYLRENGCDLVTLPPSVYARLGDRARRGIRTVVFAGEALSDAEFRAAAQHSRVLNAYGPTEGTVCFSVAEPTRFTTSVGRPIDGFEARVRTPGHDGYRESGQGELVLVGDGVALGYEGRQPDAAGPFTTVGGRPAYYTGDEVELRDGEVYYLGRLDDQVKRLGHRISLTSLEGTLSRLLDSRVAVLTDDGSLILAHTMASQPESVLRRYLREKLPAWEVPDVVLAVAEIPVTGSGKTDKGALRELAARAGSQPEASETETADDEEIVRGIVEKILGTEIGLATSAFDAGGTSFTIVQIQVELARLYGEEPVQKAFEQLNYDFTVEGFLEALRGRHRETASPAREVFGAVSGELADFSAGLTVLRPARPAGTESIGTESAMAFTVTGASGFIGGHVLDRLLGTRHPVTVVTRSSPEQLIKRHCARFGRREPDFAGIWFLSYDSLPGAVEDIGPWDAVVHCGFEVNHVLPLDRHLKGSIATTRSLLRAAASASARRFVFLSTASIGEQFAPFTVETLGAAGDPYSQAKFIAEAYAQALESDQCRVDLLRAGLVYGHTERERAFLEDDVFACLLRLSAWHDMLPRLPGLIPVCHVADVVDDMLAAAAASMSEEGKRSVLVQRTYDVESLREELGLGGARLADPREWLATVTEAGTADPRMLTALRLWMEEPGWGRPVRATDQAIIGALGLAAGR